MARVLITGRTTGFRTVPIARLLQRDGGVNLSLAQELTDRVLRRECVAIDVSEGAGAQRIRDRVAELGAEARMDASEP